MTPACFLFRKKYPYDFFSCKTIKRNHMSSSLETRKTLSGSCHMHNTLHAYGLIFKTIQISIQSGRTAGMQKEDVGAFFEISLSYKVDKSGHRLA